MAKEKVIMPRKSLSLNKLLICAHACEKKNQLVTLPQQAYECDMVYEAAQQHACGMPINFEDGNSNDDDSNSMLNSLKNSSALCIFFLRIWMEISYNREH